MAATEDSDIPETGAVFTFGKSKFADNLPNKFWVKNDRVTQVACGDEHTALVVESGRVFMFGLNDWGQLGLGQDVKPGINKPSCIKTLKHEKSQLVACGRSHTIISTEAGHIYSFGSNSEGQLGIADAPDQYTPKHIESLEATNYKMLTAGSDCSMALTEDGRLFVWGGNEDGKLGLGDDLQNASVPAHLEFDHTVVCVACGYYHTAVVTDDGKLYTMGEADGGKLGLPDDVENTKVPNHVTAIPDPVRWVACGSSHTVALTEFGECYVFGEGENGQLGLGTDLLSTSTPTLLQLPFKVVRVFCGQDFTALISEKGQLYTFGDGRHGKLGHGSDQFSNLYKPNHCKRFSHFTVEKVACGGCHMIVTAKVKNRDRNIESEDEADELSDTLSKSEESPSLTRSLSARERRRNELQKSYSSLSQTLPALTAIKGLSSLNATMPVLKSSQPKINGHPLNKTVVPKLHNIPNGKASHINSSAESEEGSEEESEEHKPTKPTLPMASPRRQPPQLKEQNHVEDGSDGDDEDDSESENEAKHMKERIQNKNGEEKDEQNEVNNILEQPSKQEDNLDSDLELKKADVQKENSELQLVDENANEKVEKFSDEVEELDEEETTPRESPTAQVPVVTPRRKKSDVQHEEVKQAEEDAGSDENDLKQKDEEEKKDHKDKEKDKKNKKDDKDNDDKKEKTKKEKKKKNKKDDKEEEVEGEEEDDDKKPKSKKDKKKKEKDKAKKKGRDDEDEDDEEEEKDKKKVKAKKKDKNTDKMDDKSKKKKNKKDDDSEENEEDETKDKKAKKQTEEENKDKKTEENITDKKNKDRVKNGEQIVTEKAPVKANPPKKSRLCVIL